jgi:hypothetical protein
MLRNCAVNAKDDRLFLGRKIGAANRAFDPLDSNH